MYPDRTGKTPNQRLKLPASPVTALALLHLPHLRRILVLRPASLRPWLRQGRARPRRSLGASR
jgi:hypothetical protein